MSERRVVIDACVLINLLATGREVELTRALGWSWLMSEHTRGETLFLHTPPDDEGRRQRLVADVGSLERAGLLDVRALNAEWLGAFVRCAEYLPDADASAVALAGALGLALATDDPKERRVASELFPRVELLSTLGLLRIASSVLGLNDTQLAQLALDLRWRGNFLAPRRDPEREWYERLLGLGGA